MATIGVVREVETGSIANFRSTPISKAEFLFGKEFPYVVVGMLTFIRFHGGSRGARPHATRRS
jgi:ribosome-dependent ATPase